MIPATALQILQRRFGSADWRRWQAQRWQQYDWIRYPAAGTTQLRFFSVVLGQQDPTSTLAKTLEQTNLTKAASFGQVYYIITQIRTFPFFIPKGRQIAALENDTDLLYTTISNAMSKFVELMRRGVLNISILQKQYFDIERPFVNAPPGFGIDIQQHAASFLAAYTNSSLWARPNPDGAATYDVNPPQVVEPENNITVTIDYPTTSPVFTGLVNSADPRIDVGVLFDGYIVRPAQ